MGYITTFCSMVFYFSASAQQSEFYYDYNWKICTPENARFYSTVKKTDSGWLRNDYFIAGIKPQMQAIYEDSACKIQNGICKYYSANGYPSSIGKRVHNKREGVCVSYYSNGMMSDSAFYHNDVPAGNRFMWHRNGYLSDSIAHVNDSMDVHIAWFDDGGIAFAGYLLRNKMHGKWKFYHHNGNISAEETYDKGTAQSKVYYNEDGTNETDTLKANREVSFKKGGIPAWRKYLVKSLYWPPGYKLTNSNLVTVGIDFIINEEGKIENVEVAIPFYPQFDNIAVKIISSSPQWEPAIEHNRKVKSIFRQPVTFQQDE